MSDIYHLESFRQYEQLHYYTLRRELEDGSLAARSLAEDFFWRMQRENSHPWHWSVFKQLIRNLGRDCRSALAENLLHHEDAAKALPPHKVARWLGQPDTEEDEPAPEAGDNMYRLYCYPASEKIIILFNGDWKTAYKVRDCPQVRPHFLFAQRAAAALDEWPREWSASGQTLLPPDLTLWL